MTEKEMYAHIAEGMAADAEVVAFCEKKLAQLEKRAARPRKPKFDEAKNAFALSVIEVLEDAEGQLTAAEIAAVLGEGVKTQAVNGAIKRIQAGNVLTAADGEPVAVNIVAVAQEKAGAPWMYAIEG